jgi:hypothetical protein
VAHASGQAGVVEVIEQRDCELARRAQQVAKHRGGNLGMSSEILDQALAGEVGGGAAEIQVGRDFNHAALTLHREQHDSQMRELAGGNFQSVGQLLQVRRLELRARQHGVDARAESFGVAAELHAMAFQPQ